MLAAAFNHFLCRLLNFQSNTLVPQNVEVGRKEGAGGGEYEMKTFWELFQENQNIVLSDKILTETFPMDTKFEDSLQEVHL